MKAYVLHAVKDLRYDEMDIPECPKGWAIVKVKAAGIPKGIAKAASIPQPS